MDKTLLDLINAVYQNLREDSITSLTNEYDNLIVAFINQAKEIVEDAWQWQALRQDITWTSVQDQKQYDLTDDTDGDGDAASGSNVWLKGRTQLYHDPHGRILAFDTTTAGKAQRLRQVPYWYGKEQQVTQAGSIAQPLDVFFGSGSINFVRAPNGSSRTYQLTVVTPQDELTAIADTLTIPWRPVVTLATAWAVNERGEELGNRPILPQSVLTTDWVAQAEKDLAKAISLDANYDSSELIMDAGQIPFNGGRF